MKLFSIFQLWLFVFSLGSIDCVMDLPNWLLGLSFGHLHLSYDLYYYLSIFYLSLRWNSLLMRFWQTLSLCSWGYDSFSRTWVYCKGHHFIHSSGLLITSWKNFVDSVNYVNAIPMSWLLEFFYEVIPLLKDCSISLLYMKFPWIDRLMSKFWCIF